MEVWIKSFSLQQEYLPWYVLHFACVVPLFVVMLVVILPFGAIHGCISFALRVCKRASLPALQTMPLDFIGLS
jgi:hypothetical protein